MIVEKYSRDGLIQKVFEKKMNIKNAAKEMDINYSTAKYIIK